MLENARQLRDGLQERGFAVVSRSAAARRRVQSRSGLLAGADATAQQTIVTPIVPVLVGDDWKAALLWRALYDAGVFVNTALHPAVPPGGALLRTSVMATHDAATLDARAGGVRARQARVRGRARPASRAAEHARRLERRPTAGAPRTTRHLSKSSQVATAEEKGRF